MINLTPPKRNTFCEPSPRLAQWVIVGEIAILRQLTSGKGLTPPLLTS
jgi:hypothetical protein